MVGGFRCLRALTVSLGLFVGAAVPVYAQGTGGASSIDVVTALGGGSQDPGFWPQVYEWLEKGGDPNAVIDDDGNTFMHHTASNRLRFLREGVRRGGDCNRRNRYGATPLHFAAAQHNILSFEDHPGPESVRILLRCGADPNARYRSGGFTHYVEGNTPLHAIYSGVKSSRISNQGISGGKEFDILTVLLAEAAADPNIRNVEGDAPIMVLIRDRGVIFPSKTGHLSLFLEHGADPNTRNRKGETPLFEALALTPSTKYVTETIKAIEILLNGGADPDLRDGIGDTPLIRAAKHDEDIAEEIGALLDGGADPCLRDRDGKLAYDHASRDSEGRLLLHKAGGYTDRDTGVCVADLFEAKEAEEKLALDRDGRRRIQSCLRTRGFDPGPADGSFGPRTRAELRKWQGAQSGRTGTATGYLTRAGADALLEACKVALTPLCTGRKGPACWMEATNVPGCHVWNPNPQPEETVSWSGKCADGKASGRGRMTWRFRKDGAWANTWDEGPYADGKIHDGHWVAKYSGGAVWEGPWSDGEFEGLWVRRGSQGRDWDCRLRGEKVGISSCGVAKADRQARARRAIAMRSGPTSDYERTGTVAAGDNVRVIGEVGDGLAWIETKGGARGFVPASALEKAASAPPPGTVFRDCPSCPEMVVVPAGSFMMGSPPGEKGRTRTDAEGPVHRVTISAPFAVAKYEMTFAEWDACVAEGGCRHRPDDQGWGRGNRPVINVSWEDAKSYVQWLSAKTGKAYRLLSESEWEYAARAGTSTRYSWGDETGRNRANCTGCGSRWQNIKTAPVGSFAANGFGLHDMHGNVWEGVEDCWNDSYRGAPSDGGAWLSGECDTRVFRGGSWNVLSGYMGAALRAGGGTGNRNNIIGFRIARTLTP